MMLKANTNHGTFGFSKHPPTSPGPCQQEFRRTLKRLYGSVHAGWVKYLDVTEARVPDKVSISFQQVVWRNYGKERFSTVKFWARPILGKLNWGHVAIAGAG